MYHSLLLLYLIRCLLNFIFRLTPILSRSKLILSEYSFIELFNLSGDGSSIPIEVTIFVQNESENENGAS